MVGDCEWLAVMPAQAKKPPNRSKPPAKRKLRVEGLKYFAMLRPLLTHLHEDQCSRDKAGNRTLHYDQYCMLVLLYVLNPTVSSLRALSQASELTKVREKLRTQAASIGSLSESSRLYVMDRGYAKFALFNAIVAAGSSYACRLRDNTVYEVAEHRPLTAGDHAAGVLSDQIVLLGQSSKNSDEPDHIIRMVQIRCTPHHNRTGGKAKGSTAPNSDGILRIATNLLDVPAEIIALIYSYRWTIEIFFRFYKQLMGGSHLISHSDNGIEIQVYCSMIACLLINLWTGGKPNKRTFEMVSYYFQGLASEEELLAHIEKQRKAAETKRQQAESSKIC
jgi:hypothetical protein